MTGRGIQREMLRALLGNGMSLPRLKELQLHEARVEFGTMMPFLVAHAASTLSRLELVGCQVHMEAAEATEMGRLLERGGVKVGTLDCFPSQVERRLYIHATHATRILYQVW